MPSFRRLVLSEPLWIFAVLWPFVFLAPLVPGLSKASINSLPWRQELLIGLLLVVTLALVIKRAKASSVWSLRIPTSEFGILLPLTFFVVWSVASLLWAEGWLNAVHYNLTWAGYLICFILMRRIVERPRLLRASLAALAVVISIIGVTSALEFWSTSPEVYQFGLILRRSTGLGEPLAVSVPMFATLAITVRNRRAALLCGTATVLAWLGTLQTLERAPLLAVGAGLTLVVVGVCAKKAWRPHRPKQALLLLAVLFATTAFQTIGAGTPSSSFQRVQDLKDNDPTAQIRILLWAIGLEMIHEHPLHGVGANNYELAYPTARGQFSAKHPDSKLVNQQEDLLAQRAHNEYVQILAELGAIGFALFLMFSGALIWMAARALRSAHNPLALGAVCSLTTFAVSSGASSISFRWLASGLLFFFAAAITLRFASAEAAQKRALNLTPFFVRTATASGLVLAMVMFGGMSALGVSSTLRAMALLAPTGSQGDDSRTQPAEHFFRQALSWNPYDAPTHFDFGGWLYGKHRYEEAVQHLRFATQHGFNSSTCYAFLAGAEAAAHDTTATEQTLAMAVSVYPRSVFLRVRHSIALAEAGRSLEAAREYETAVLTDALVARGWRQLMCFGPDSAYAAAQADSSISPPKKLTPQSWAYPAIAEHATRPPFAYPADPHVVN